MLRKAEADLVVHHQHRLGRIARKDRVALAVDRHVGSCVGKRAAAGSGDLISGIAADDERVRRARHAGRAGHVGGVRGRVDAVGQAQDSPFVKHKGVVARAGEVDLLEVLERRCRGRRDVERGRAAVEAQYIGARTAVDRSVSPVSKTNTSLPAPPISTSLPAPPSIVSLPSPPIRMSSPLVPVRVSFPVVPAFVTPVNSPPKNHVTGARICLPQAGQRSELRR